MIARLFRHRVPSPSLVLLMTGLMAEQGCSRPMQANIDLRKENQELHKQVETLTAQKQASEAIRVATTRRATGDGGAVDLSKLFTADSLSFGRLTAVQGGVLRVYVTPVDQFGDSLKAAGGFDVLAFDLSRGTNALVGQWSFTPEQAGKAWNGKGLLYCYVLECPLTPEQARTITPEDEGKVFHVRLTFQDLLTGRTLVAERDAKVIRSGT